ncbi:MAG: metal-dependent hydrolase [Deltaproteobacteria bacterium]
MGAIPRRALDFDFSDVDRDWYANDPFVTAFFNAFSILLPEGERFFVDAVKRFRDLQPEAEADIAGFIGQEAMHGRAHRGFNAMLVEQGFTQVPKYERRLRRLLDFGRRRLSARSQLGITVALEHITALLAEQLLVTPEHNDAATGAVQRLWLWHALEETEHKHVAFDLLAQVDGSYGRRVGTMLLSSFFLVVIMSWYHVGLLRERGKLFDFGVWRRGMGKLWGEPGLLRVLIVPYLAYFAPSFHPVEHSHPDRLIQEWRQRLALS